MLNNGISSTISVFCLFFPNMHAGTRDVHVAFHDPTSWTKTSSCPSSISISVVSHQLRPHLHCHPGLSYQPINLHSVRVPIVSMSAGRVGKSSWRLKSTTWTYNHHPQTHGYLFRLSNQQPSCSENMLDKATCGG